MKAQLVRPNGPKGVPLLGTLPALARDPLGYFCDLGRSYGDISCARIGAGTAYMVSHPDLIEEVLIGKYRDCMKDLGTRELIPLVGQGLLTSEGEHWKRQRKLAAPPLQPKRIGNYADAMVRCTERELAGFRDDEVRNIHVDMMRLTLEIVGKTLLGIEAGRDSERIGDIVDASLAYLDKQLYSWQGLAPKWLPTLERYNFRQAMVELDALVLRAIRRCREHGTAADHLLARLVHARDESGEAMSDLQLRDEAVTMLLAGHETTAIALTFAVYLLSEHPEIAARLRSELETQLGGRRPRVEDLPKLRYLDAVARETLRLYPPAYVFAREVTRSFEVGGFTIPKGDQVAMSAYVVQRDARWYPEPERFRPDRWLDGSTDGLPRFAYFPFGGGPRVCIGNHFAMMEIALVLAVLTQDVELTVVPGFALELAPIVTLRPARGVRVLVRRRRPRYAAATRRPDAFHHSASDSDSDHV
jgi:cytochrome P450